MDKLFYHVDEMKSAMTSQFIYGFVIGAFSMAVVLLGSVIVSPYLADKVGMWLLTF